MKLKNLLFFIVAIFALTNYQLFSGETLHSKTQFGGYAHFQSVIHIADFNNLPGLNSCCTEYGNGTGPGFAVGVLYKMPLGDITALDLRLGFNTISGETRAEEFIGHAYDLQWNTVKAISEYKLNSTLSMIEFLPQISLKPFDAPFYINLGLQAGFVIGKSYDFSEELISPDNAQFIDGTKLREVTGDLEEVSPLFLSGLGIMSYDIPVSKSLILSPELGFAYNFTNIVSDVTWKANSIRLGFSIKYHAPPPPPPPAAEPPPAKMPEPPPPPVIAKLDASIKAFGVNEAGDESSVTKIKSQEFLSRRIHPMLRYIFFDENSADIPHRYAKIRPSGIDKFDIKMFSNHSTIEVYHNILNIVGSRMTENPKAKLTVTGCASSDSIENENKALSLKRAEIIKDYLVNTWKIDNSRIKVKSRGLPSYPSNTEDIDGIEENRRVEFRSNDPDIFAPLTLRDTIIETTPPKLMFKIDFESEAGLAKWEVKTMQGDRILKTNSGEGAPPSSLTWVMAEDRNSVPRTDDDLVYTLRLTDKAGTKWYSGKKTMPVQAITTRNKYLAIMDGKHIKDKEYDVFSLISFGFNKSELISEHKPIIEVAKSRIKENSIVTVTGYSDRSGEAGHNLQLSHQRAMATANALGIDVSKALGIGEEDPQFDNDLPEGRFYNRSVYIIIETPVENK